MRPQRFLPGTRPALAAVLVPAAVVLSACAGEDEAMAPDLEAAIPDIRGDGDPGDPYVGLLDASFREDLEAYAQQEVTLLADVGEVLSPRVFVVTSPEGAEAEPILTVTTSAVGDVDPEAGRSLVIAATPVRDFDGSVVIDELDLDIDAEQLDEWEDETFLVATIVEPAP